MTYAFAKIIYIFSLERTRAWERHRVTGISNPWYELKFVAMVTIVFCVM